MAYTPSENRLGIGSFTQIDSSAAYTANSGTASNAAVAPGTIVRGFDPTYGGGEFIYLPGCGSTVVGAVVTYDVTTPTTTLVTNAILGAPLAVAMSANTGTTNYGWYQIAGAAVIKKTAVKVSPGVPLYLSGTSGRLMSTVATGKAVLNCRSVNAATVASATSTITAVIDRPASQLVT